MKDLFIKTILVVAFLVFVVGYYAKHGQSDPVIYNEVQSAEDHNMERLMEEDQEQEKQQVDTVVIQTIRERKI